MFLSRDAIIWAQHLGLNVDSIYDGDKPNIKGAGTVIQR